MCVWLVLSGIDKLFVTKMAKARKAGAEFEYAMMLLKETMAAVQAEASGNGLTEAGLDQLLADES